MAGAAPESVRAAVQRALQREGLQATIGDDGAVAFAPTLGLDGAAIDGFFRAYLAENGLSPAALAATEAVGAAAAIDAAVRTCAMTRRRVVDEGAFVGGGFAVPFAGVPEAVRQRGLALYRFPRRAPVSLLVRPAGVRIRVPSGSLGTITSSGFWLPTYLAGDFDVAIEHRLRHWRPGSGPACFGLHAADRSTMRTYYAQWTSEPGQPTLPGTVLGDRPLRHGRADPSLGGTLRLRREGCLVTAWYRGPGACWQLLGSRGDDPGAPMLFGAKVWAFGDCAGLVADIRACALVGNVADVDEAPPPFAADPQCHAWKVLADRAE